MRDQIKSEAKGFEVAYELEEVHAILMRCRKALGEFSTVYKSQDICVLMPDYFRQLVSLYFTKEFNGKALGSVVFGTRGSFFGCRNFFPSADNTITIYDLNAPFTDTAQGIDYKVIINLKDPSPKK